MKKEYPEHEKMSTIVDKSQSIGEFIEWLNDTKNYKICEKTGDFVRYYPIRKSVECLLAEFFGIDLGKIEQEKREMLEDIREMNKGD